MAVSQGSGIPKKPRKQVDIRDQHDGILDKPQRDPMDRYGRVLNYPGLSYYHEKIANGLRADLSDLDVDIDALSDPEVRRILGGWAEGELDDGWNARAADKLATARQIALSGDVSGDAMFDGSKDIVIGTAVECLTTTEIDDLMAQSMAIGG